MLDLLVSGKTRLKLLTKFFLAPEIRGHLRGLAEEFGESTNAIRQELNRFEQGGLLVSEMDKNRKVFRANRSHPLYADMVNILRKHAGVDRLVEHLVGKLGNVSEAYIVGDMAVGRDRGHIDLLLVGDDINLVNLERLALKAGQMIGREIRWKTISTEKAKVIGERKDAWKIL